MVQKKEKQWSPVGCVQGRVLWFCCCVCISQLLAGSFCASAAMFFFYVSFWLAELAADWLIVQGGYYMAAIAMRSSPIIPFRRDHREPPVPPPPTISPLFLLPSLSSCPPHPPTPTHMQSWVNRAPPALRTDGCRKRQEPCFLLLFTPRSLSLIHLLKPQFFPLLIICPCSTALLKFHLLSLTRCISKNAVNESSAFFQNAEWLCEGITVWRS